MYVFILEKATLRSSSSFARYVRTASVPLIDTFSLTLSCFSVLAGGENLAYLYICGIGTGVYSWRFLDSGGNSWRVGLVTEKILLIGC
jgi:hypothetical protein